MKRTSSGWVPALWKYSRATQDPRLPDILARYFAACLQADPFREDGWTAAFRDLLAQLTNTPSFTRLGEDLSGMQAEVRDAAAAWYELARRL